ncbi:MAG: DUF3048 domain-containing protein [Chloroflexi bacterium]|nr:DUF3048 domain-containing protein [Chloroflexota bacterium]
MLIVLLVPACANGSGNAADGASSDSITIPAAPVTSVSAPAANRTAELARAPVRTPTATPQVMPPDVLGPFHFPPGYNPLTGLPAEDPTAMDRRPLAVKISNAPEVVRPQAGIGEADLVFEHLTEGNLTRFTAIFWTHTPPRVGSIRSARLLDLEIPAMYGTLFAYSGAAEPIRQRIADLPFAPRAYEGVTTGQPLYFRDPDIEVPHNLFVIPGELWARAEADGVNAPPEDLGGMAFRAAPPPDGTSAAAIAIDYGPDTVRWTYDGETGVYARFVNDEPHTDANTEQQVTAANVVVVFAHHQEDYTIVESEWQGTPYYSLEIQIWTLGPVMILRDGQMIEGHWMRWEEDTMLSFWTDETATEQLYLKPGNTWVQVVPLGFAGLEISEETQ